MGVLCCVVVGWCVMVWRGVLGCIPFRSLGVESYGTRIIGLHIVYDVNVLSIMSMTMSRGSAGHR